MTSGSGHRLALRVAGVPSGPRPRDGASWREQVARAAAGALAPAEGLHLRFALRPGQFVDLDTLAQTAVAGMRDGGVYPRGLPGLDALVAEKRDDGAPTGLEVQGRSAAALAGIEVPGPVALDAAAEDLPGATRGGKAAWRAVIAASWGGAAPLDAPEVWADVALRVPGSVLAPLEPILDALEPALGRDPRGRDWQEFFPNDHRITWLRVRRVGPGEPRLRLVLGPRTHVSPRDGGLTMG